MTIHTDSTDDFDEMLRALSNPVRRKILSQMKEPEKNFPGQDHSYELGVCAGKIDDTCGLSQSTVSAHLAVLLNAKLITARKIGQWVFYKRNEAAITAFLDRLGQSL
jgi:DNA-binding transcriptional ArsR family regulator